ncbi:MAG: hypothetical protein HC927_09060 [Deltaproteobacteria bacterium]|nr:hypothetical protein [Deltaproteobacteria bacterium]
MDRVGNPLEARDPATGAVTRYEWDEDGQLVRKHEPNGGTWSYRWNDLGQLVAVERPDGAVVEFGYDAFSRRLWKRCQGRMTRWIWDGDVTLHEWEELDAASVPEESRRAPSIDEDEERTGFVLPAFVPDPARAIIGDDETTGHVEPAFVQPRARVDAGDFLRPAPRGLITWLFEPDRFAPIAKVVAGVALSVIVDHLGTPLSLLDGQGREAWGASYDVDGGVDEEQGEEGACRFRFPGQYADAETGLYFNFFRYYDPVAGVYVSSDPLGIEAGGRLLAYVPDPQVWVDPFGLSGINYSCWDLFSDRFVGGFHVTDGVNKPVGVYGIRNLGGGETWVFCDVVNPLHVVAASYRADVSVPVNILYGVHGSVDGLVINKFDAHVIRHYNQKAMFLGNNDPFWIPYMQNINQADVHALVMQNDFRGLSQVINGPGRVVCGWCNSERSIVVQHALAGTFI